MPSLLNPHKNLMILEWRHCHSPHLTDEDTGMERFSNLPKDTQWHSRALKPEGFPPLCYNLHYPVQGRHMGAGVLEPTLASQFHSASLPPRHLPFSNRSRCVTSPSAPLPEFRALPDLSHPHGSLTSHLALRTPLCPCSTAAPLHLSYAVLRLELPTWDFPPAKLQLHLSRQVLTLHTPISKCSHYHPPPPHPFLFLSLSFSELGLWTIYLCFI